MEEKAGGMRWEDYGGSDGGGVRGTPRGNFWKEKIHGWGWRNRSMRTPGFIPCLGNPRNDKLVETKWKTRLELASSPAKARPKNFRRPLNRLNRRHFNFLLPEIGQHLRKIITG